MHRAALTSQPPLEGPRWVLLPGFEIGGAGHQEEPWPLQFIQQGGWGNDDSQESLTSGTCLFQKGKAGVPKYTHRQKADQWSLGTGAGTVTLGAERMTGDGNVLKPSHSDGSPAIHIYYNSSKAH